MKATAKSRKANGKRVAGGQWSVVSIFLGVFFYLSTVYFPLTTVHAQPPQFAIDHYVIASGGGSSAGTNGLIYTVEGTVGQGLAGTLSDSVTPPGTYIGVVGGFWAFQSVAPTAAHVSVAGRVVTAGGEPVFRAFVSLTGPTGTRHVALSNPFGYYRIYDVEVGETYLIEVSSRLFQFTPRVIMIQDELTDLDIIALP